MMSQVENLDKVELAQHNFTYLLSAWPTLPRWGCLCTCRWARWLLLRT